MNLIVINAKNKHRILTAVGHWLNIGKHFHLLQLTDCAKCAVCQSYCYGHLTFHEPPKFAPTLSMIPFSCNAAICLWVFFLDNDRISAIFDIEVVGFAEMIDSICFSVSVSSFTPRSPLSFTPFAASLPGA